MYTSCSFLTAPNIDGHAMVLLPDARIAMRDNDNPVTHVFSPGLTDVETFNGDYGILKGMVPPGLLLYVRQVSC